MNASPMPTVGAGWPALMPTATGRHRPAASTHRPPYRHKAPLAPWPPALSPAWPAPRQAGGSLSIRQIRVGPSSKARPSSSDSATAATPCCSGSETRIKHPLNLPVTPTAISRHLARGAGKWRWIVAWNAKSCSISPFPPTKDKASVGTGRFPACGPEVMSPVLILEAGSASTNPAASASSTTPLRCHGLTVKKSSGCGPDFTQPDYSAGGKKNAAVHYWTSGVFTGLGAYERARAWLRRALT